MLLDQQSLASGSSASPAGTLIRSGSEPPDQNFNEINGLRRSRNPIKVAGITMGSQENVNDELAAVFANRRRRRRSATPVKIGGIVMGEDGEDNDSEKQQLPFGGGGGVSKRNSYHPGCNGQAKRNSSIGMWGQRMFINGHNFDTDTSQKPQKTGENVDNVKQFLTEMHSEIKAMTSNLTNGHSSTENLEHPQSDSELPNLISVEETVVINTDDKDKEDIIEIEADQVKYHTGQTPHPSRFDPSKAFQIMSEAEDNDEEIIEVNPGDVHYHDGARQVGLLVPSKPRHESKSPSPHLAIISDFIDSRRQKEKLIISNVVKDEKVQETAVVTTVQVEQASSSIESVTTKEELNRSTLTMANTSSAASTMTSHVQASMSTSSSSSIQNQVQKTSTVQETYNVQEIQETSTVQDTKQEFHMTSTVQDSKQEIQETSTVQDFNQQVQMTSMSSVQECKQETKNVQEFQMTSTVQDLQGRLDAQQVPKTSTVQDEISMTSTEKDNLFIMDKNETKKMEELFDKLVAEESIDEKLGKPKRSRSFDAIEKWLLNNEEHKKANLEPQQIQAKAEETQQEKLAKKRLRNRTIDFSSLPNNAEYYNVTATCTSKTYDIAPNLDQDNTEPKLKSQTSTESEPESCSSGLSGRKPGLCLIIDKLKSIESKLDELKTMDAVGNETTEDNDDEDNTLKDDDHEEVSSQATDVSHTTELFVPDENIVVSSPVATPTLAKTSTSHLVQEARKSHVDIMSIHTMSEVDDADDEDDDEDISSGRQSRIEMLAKKIMEEEAALAQLEQQRQRHNSNPEIKRDPINLNAELDTVSERSEIEEDSSLSECLRNETNGRRSADHLQQQPEKGSFRNRRTTRSASRERNLAKIRFCWRCHQTGHESFDCSAELQPANWCPRCLETSHWEDNCWVNEQEVFCNICALPGHLPCVHQTNDFRQRKLVIETFGWLAFKDWFREPEFWSWWNCSGFTNVPLYKLMQHRPHVASPTDLQEITE